MANIIISVPSPSKGALILEPANKENPPNTGKSTKILEKMVKDTADAPNNRKIAVKITNNVIQDHYWVDQNEMERIQSIIQKTAPSTAISKKPATAPISFKGVLTKAQIKVVYKTIMNLKKSSEERFKSEEEIEIEKVVTYQGCGTMREHYVKGISFTILTMDERINGSFASGNFKKLYKIKELVTPTLSSSASAATPLYALALAVASDELIRMKDNHAENADKDAKITGECEGTFLTMMHDNPNKIPNGIIPIKHKVYYVHSGGNVRVGMLLHYANGGSLKAWALSKEELEKTLTDKHTLIERLRICRDIADGLISCGERGIIHADVKPDNVLLEKYQDPKTGKIRHRAYLSDFGLAYQPTSTDVNIPKEHHGGSPQYWAPELWGHGQPKDNFGPEIDAFAFGLLAYEILIGPLCWCQGLKPWNVEKVALTKAVDNLVILRSKILTENHHLFFISALLDIDPTKRWTASYVRNFIHLTIQNLEQQLENEEGAQSVAAIATTASAASK